MASPVLLAIWVAMGFAGYSLGSARGKPVIGAALGFCLGFIGLIIIALFPKRDRVNGYAPAYVPQAPPAMTAEQIAYHNWQLQAQHAAWQQQVYGNSTPPQA